MKFIADVMLGRLAKRLRLLGFDVLYDPLLDDNSIIRLSLEQDRLILTRDAGLAARPLANRHLFLSAVKVQDQLSQFLHDLRLEAECKPLTRCSECNGLLTPAAKEELKDLVPPYVYEHHEGFRMCKACGRIYWTGTHVKRMGIKRIGAGQ
ncbi:MAG: hypothetical protein A2010_01310 [Nitrospirae bacterium GWD2_57_9]|nr:MAG: hypothetical protein A2010_01310 [Nitrospirae bacterium GWD2_57_9]